MSKLPESQMNFNDPYYGIENQTTEDLFRIVPDPSKQVEEKPSLTYEQALECEKVIIKYPHIDLAIIHSRECIWKFDDLLYFDLAERRGYSIEAVD